MVDISSAFMVMLQIRMHTVGSESLNMPMSPEEYMYLWLESQYFGVDLAPVNGEGMKLLLVAVLQLSLSNLGQGGTNVIHPLVKLLIC